MKKNLLTIIIIIVIIIVIGIIIKKNSSNKNIDDRSLEYILNKGELVLGLDDCFPPIGFRNTDNEIVGFDIDLAKEVCKRLEVELVCQPISWAAKVEELNSKNIDCVWNGMSITEDRKKEMNISNSYMENEIVFVTFSQSNINSFEDLKGKKVGVQIGTTADEAVETSDKKDIFSELITYNDTITAFMDMDAKQVDAIFVDKLMADYYINKENKDYKIIGTGIIEQYGIGFRKNDEKLKNAIEKKIEEIKEDGTMAKISSKWFGEDLSK